MKPYPIEIWCKLFADKIKNINYWNEKMEDHSICQQRMEHETVLLIKINHGQMPKWTWYGIRFSFSIPSRTLSSHFWGKKLSHGMAERWKVEHNHVQSIACHAIGQRQKKNGTLTTSRHFTVR